MDRNARPNVGRITLVCLDIWTMSQESPLVTGEKSLPVSKNSGEVRISQRYRHAKILSKNQDALKVRYIIYHSREITSNQ